MATRRLHNEPQHEAAPGSGSSGGEREILLNAIQRQKFASNKVTTAKYSTFTFLHRFLIEQFRRYQNVYFLSVGLLQQIPDVSPTGRFVTIVPFAFILLLSAIRELIEDYKRHRADDRINHSLASVFRRDILAFEDCKWQDIQVGDIVRVDKGGLIPADLVILASSDPQGICYIETSSLDGETNLKIRSAVQQTIHLDHLSSLGQASGELNCEGPNQKLYEFHGNIQMEHGPLVSLTSSAVLPRGAKLMNTAWIYGIVVYAGHETKLLMNSTKAPLKRSTMDKNLDQYVVVLFIMLVLLTLISALGSFIVNSADRSNHFYVQGYNFRPSFLSDLITFFILYNNLIPISLHTTLEIIKFIQTFFIESDQQMLHLPSDTHASARTSNLNEELGQVEYVFSDKTGTLTQNVMEFKRASIAGSIFDVDQADSASQVAASAHSDIIEQFFLHLSVCHTVIPEEAPDGALTYNASSPDEKALVEGADKFGFTFLARKPESVMVMSANTLQEYQVLNVIEFTSDRKRMSVVVRCPDGCIKVLTKGADNVIFDRLGSEASCRQFYDITLQHLEMFATEGLRTLCITSRQITDRQYEDWAQRYHQASVALRDREQKMESVADEIERDLVLLGATAIEDKLQDGVPSAISTLLQAHIHLWVLTGDKQETAINIGYSCKLLSSDMQVILINTSGLDQTRKVINQHLNQFRLCNMLDQCNAVGLVVDGQSITYALDDSVVKDFVDLCCSCSSVICCRVSPMQKADMVQLIQKHKKKVCLAIGDGANDVAMIQKANVGVGIAGNEGLQAANSSDFTIGQFRFLVRLLLVHGSYFHDRNAKFIYYSFYKNICLYVIEFWFAIYNFWSGQVLFERWTIALYNIIFTFFPPIAIGLLDLSCSENTKIRFPWLYKETQQLKNFNLRLLLLWVFMAIVDSAVLFFPALYMFGSISVWGSGLTGDYLIIGNTVYSCVVITVCLKVYQVSNAWFWQTHAAIWISIALWFLFLLVYSYIWPLVHLVGAEMTGIVLLIASTPVSYLVLVMCIAITLVISLFVLTLHHLFFPGLSFRVRYMEQSSNGDSGSTLLALNDVSVPGHECDPEPVDYGRNRACTSSAAAGRSRSMQEASKFLRQVTSHLRPLSRGLSQDEKNDADIELASTHGYAFSQEEDGAISQSHMIRMFDTTTPRPQSQGVQGKSEAHPSPGCVQEVRLDRTRRVVVRVAHLPTKVRTTTASPEARQVVVRTSQLPAMQVPTKIRTTRSDAKSKEETIQLVKN